MWMKLDDFVPVVKRSDRWLCFRAWRRVALLNTAADSFSSSVVIKEHLHHYLFMARYEELYFNLTGHLRCSDVCFLLKIAKSAICSMWTQDRYTFKYRRHWCMHYIYSCVYFSIITRHVCSFGASVIWSVYLAERKEINHWLLGEQVQIVMCDSSTVRLWATHWLENQRTGALICDDTLIYSLELLRWPWMGDWLCVVIPCLPEVFPPN